MILASSTASIAPLVALMIDGALGFTLLSQEILLSGMP